MGQNVDRSCAVAAAVEEPLHQLIKRSAVKQRQQDKQVEETVHVKEMKTKTSSRPMHVRKTGYLDAVT
jgi:hypothetical protein